MKAFRFRAQAVLDLRSRHRDRVQAELARALRAQHEATAAWETAEHRGREASALALVTMRAGGSIGEFERHRNWIAHLRVEIDRCRLECQARAAEVARMRERLRLAHQEVRVLERLRDHTWHRYQEAVQQTETRDLSEIATLRWVRQRRQEGSERDR